MKMEIPDDAEDLSCQLIGALSAVRDLVAGQSPLNHELPVSSSDMGYLLELLKGQAERAHDCKFGPRAPKANND